MNYDRRAKSNKLRQALIIFTSSVVLVKNSTDLFRGQLLQSGRLQDQQGMYTDLSSTERNNNMHINT